ncbi:hypothetical protein CJ196_07530 [Bifidobacterium breve]|nr:hypothetical protein CYJ38_09440 [Bifidobacterium breve]PMC72621.1 hypothetical protein CJ196_07530 [Bifidobacterium breve]
MNPYGVRRSIRQPTANRGRGSRTPSKRSEYTTTPASCRKTSERNKGHAHVRIKENPAARGYGSPQDRGA